MRGILQCVLTARGSLWKEHAQMLFGGARVMHLGNLPKQIISRASWHVSCLKSIHGLIDSTTARTVLVAL
jgi:hypothetical protein